MRCTLNGQRFEVSSGIFIVNDSWSDTLQLIKGKTEEIKALNIRLEKIKTKIQDIHNQLESSGEPFDIMSIKDKFLGRSINKGLMEVFDEVIGNIEARLHKGYEYATLKQYRTTRNRIKEFIT